MTLNPLTRQAPAPLVGANQDVPAAPKVAVLLNRNARQVTDAMALAMERVVGAEHLYYSRSLGEAEQFARAIVQRGYGTVVCGGGDGTLIKTFNLVQHYVAEANAWRAERARRFHEQQDALRMPRFAFLSLGTGNGLRRVVGATDPLGDLQHVVSEKNHKVHEVAVIKCGTERFLFGGCGYDSLLLNDYNAVKQNLGRGPARQVMSGLPGYLVALFGRTLPRLMRMPPLRGRIVTLSEATYMDPRRGDAAVSLGQGSVLHEGPMTMLGVGTTPFFGYGLKVFPFAGVRPGRFHLRVACLSPGQALGHLPGIWRGTYRSAAGLRDFLASKVQVELEAPFPFQHSGDGQGERSSFTFELDKEPLRLIDLYGRA